MPQALTIVVVALALVAALVALLRVVSRRRSTACPAWLIPLLENPYMDAVAGPRLLLDRAGVAAGMAVLDMGCGPGRIAIPAARRVGPAGRVLAVDLQAAMLERLRARVAEQGLDNVETLHGEAGSGALPEEAFDRAFLVTVLGEIVDRPAALGSIYRALRPGGILSVTEVLPDPHYQSRREVRRLAREAGFEVRAEGGNALAFTMNLARPARS